MNAPKCRWCQKATGISVVYQDGTWTWRCQSERCQALTATYDRNAKRIADLEKRLSHAVNAG